jgi:5-formyltetrahydrofolate cyclo-ligase
MDIALRKKLLRKEMKDWLQSLSEEDILRKSGRISRHVCSLSSWKTAEVIFSFMSMEREVQTASLNQRALEEGKTVFIPRIAGPDIEFCPLGADGSGFERDRFGIPTPGALIRPVDISSLAGKRVLVLVPGLAFDRALRRIGRGKGYYDRFIARLARSLPQGSLLLGICFHGQFVEEVPVGPEDRTVDRVVTEEGPVA